jgi:hypothetical protein
MGWDLGGRQTLGLSFAISSCRGASESEFERVRPRLTQFILNFERAQAESRCKILVHTQLVMIFVSIKRHSIYAIR